MNRAQKTILIGFRLNGETVGIPPFHFNLDKAVRIYLIMLFPKPEFNSSKLIRDRN